MADNQRKARLIAEIGQNLAAETEFSKKGLLMIAGVAKGYLAISVFSDRGPHVAYRVTKYSRYENLLNELWSMEPLSKRWEEVEFFLKGNEFQTKFVYFEDIDPDDLTIDRWHQAAEKYFGGKPIKYPSWDDSNSWTL
ncbi:hypothetical protein [Blastomonas sp.]|uniref:hypothetical protein n=1 Tax=Blastomonas sp. TaxID=1909299 RepID=UPI00391A945E